MGLAIIILNCFEISLRDSTKGTMSCFGAIDRFFLYIYSSPIVLISCFSIRMCTCIVFLRSMFTFLVFHSIKACIDIFVPKESNNVEMYL